MSFRNRAKCRHCGDIVESKHAHDFQSCSCFIAGLGRGFFLDGGLGSDGHGLGTRYGGNFDDVEWMTEDTVTDQIARTY